MRIGNILAQEEQPCRELKGVIPIQPAQQQVTDQRSRYGQTGRDGCQDPDACLRIHQSLDWRTMHGQLTKSPAWDTPN